MKSYNFHLYCLLIAALFFPVLCPQKTHAALTKQLSYQGRLNNASGQPVANGTYSIVFSIYNVSSGGSALWTETQNVSVDKGGFSAYLGSVTPLTLPFNEDYYLGIKVGSDPEMTPRLKLAIVGTAAFSLEAGMLQGKAASDFALSTHNHDSNYSASAHTHTPTGVTQIVAGANVTISPTGGTGVVTINAAGGGGGSSLTPASTVQPVTSASVVGTSTNYAREDHQHNLVSNFITDSLVSSSAGIATSKLSGTVTSISGHGLGSLATLNAVSGAEIQDATITFADLSQNGCASGQVVEWNGTAWVCGTDDVGGGGAVVNNPGATQTIIAGNSTTTPIVLKGAAGTSVPMFEVQDSAGTTKLGVMPDGHVYIPSTNQLHVLSINNDSPTGPMGNMTVDVMNSAANSKLILQNSDASFTAGLDIEGNVLVGAPTTTTAKVSALETGIPNYAGYFEVNNASNAVYALYATTNSSTAPSLGAVSTGGGEALVAANTGTGRAARFQISNAGNSSSLIFGDITSGTGSLLQLQQGGVNKFAVVNSGDVQLAKAGTSLIDVKDAGNTVLNITNSLAGSASLQVEGATVLTSANGVITNPGAAQTILPTADIVPLILKDDAAAVADLFDIQNNGGTTLLKVNPSGNLLVGNPTITLAKVSAYETGSGNYAGVFSINNAGNPNAAILGTTNGTGEAVYANSTGSGAAVHGYATGTGTAGYFQTNNAGNTSPVILGDTNGTGNLLQLQQTGINKFVVDNTGNVLLDGNANPSIKASGATPNLILDADGTGASIVKVKNTTSPGSVLFQTEGAITAFNGTNAVPVSSGATQELIQKGNACEAIATNGTISVTFTPAFSATPTVTFGQTGGTTAPAAISLKNSSSFTVSGFETGGTSECIDWIAIGNK